MNVRKPQQGIRELHPPSIAAMLHNPKAIAEATKRAAKILDAALKKAIRS